MYGRGPGLFYERNYSLKPYGLEAKISQEL